MKLGKIKVKEIIDNEVVLISLEPTRHLQLWNKWELYYLLTNSDEPIKFEVGDFPMSKKELRHYAKKLKK
jgi:hypothetical protein